jgi:CRP-like cAMP-binding protein
VAELGAGELAELRARGRLRRWRPGEVVFSEGDHSDDVHLVEEGHLKVSSFSEDGQEVVLAVFGPGELVGELSAVDHRTRSGTLTALEAAATTQLAAPAFEEFLRAHPDRTLMLLRIVTRRLRDADLRGVEYATVDLPGRLAARLVDLAVRFGVRSDDAGGLSVAVSHDELAAWTASSREAVSKALAGFRVEGWVRTARRQVVVTNLPALRQRSQRPTS